MKLVQVAEIRKGGGGGGGKFFFLDAFLFIKAPSPFLNIERAGRYWWLR